MDDIRATSSLFLTQQTGQPGLSSIDRDFRHSPHDLQWFARDLGERRERQRRKRERSERLGNMLWLVGIK